MSNYNEINGCIDATAPLNARQFKVAFPPDLAID